MHVCMYVRISYVCMCVFVYMDECLQECMCVYEVPVIRTIRRSHRAVCEVINMPLEVCTDSTVNVVIRHPVVTSRIKITSD